jgi:xanthine dehydrogenase YagR molybdenum-binding subunit
MSARREESSWGERGSHRLLNNDIPRIDGPVKVTGRAQYTHDVRLPGMVYARFVCCPHPKAKVSLDLAPALAVPGVVDAMSVLGDREETMFLGEPVAVVAAETPDLAEDGARAIVVQYEELDWTVSRERSLEEGSARVRDEGDVRVRRQNQEGDVEQGLAASDVVIEGTFTVPVQHHVCLETHGHVIDYQADDSSAIVYGSTQGTFSLLEAARHLDIPSENVEGTVQHMGGGFGSKFGMGVEGRVACELAERIGRPVHLMLDRPQEFLCAGNRTGVVATFRAGATRDGVLKAIHARADLLGGLARGSYASQPYVYRAENIDFETRSVHTNLDGQRAMRAPGHPQASFGIEGVMDMLAYGIGMDPLEFRIANLEDEEWHRQLRRCAGEIGWAEHAHKTAPGSPHLDEGGDYREGIGFGVSVWGGGGFPECVTEVRIDRDGSVVVEVGTQDLGTGTRTYVAAIVAEELGLPIDAVTARIGRTSYGRANTSGGSVTTASLAPSVKEAAHAAREKLLAHLAPLMGVEVADIRIAAAGGVESTNGDSSMTWDQVCYALPAGGINATAEWARHLASNGVHGAQAAKVRVDLRTGEVKVLKMVCVQDLGLPMNRLAVRSQINGAMVQALSYGLLEQRVVDPWLGLALSANLEDYKVAGSLEMPEMVAIIDDEDTREQVVGVGEPPVIPGQSAIAGAIHNACGVRVFEMPMTPDRVLNALVAARAERG